MPTRTELRLRIAGQWGNITPISTAVTSSTASFEWTPLTPPIHDLNDLIDSLSGPQPSVIYTPPAEGLRLVSLLESIEELRDIRSHPHEINRIKLKDLII